MTKSSHNVNRFLIDSAAADLVSLWSKNKPNAGITYITWSL